MVSLSRRALQQGILALALSMGLPLCAAEATTLGGVRFAPTAELHGSTLQLNGAGIRYKAVFQVYAAALYLPRPGATAAEVLGQPGPKRLSVVMLRDIDTAELGKLFARGIEDNMDRATFSRLVPGVLRMSQIFSRHKLLKAGEMFSIEWLPGTGTLITVKGQAQGEPFQEPEFFDALLGIWLGHRPADARLKDALLGRPDPA